MISQFLKIISLLLFVNNNHFFSCSENKAQDKPIERKEKGIIKPGAESTEDYLPLLKEKRVALVVNPTSVIGKVHLVDTLRSLKINIVKIFSPEHGFRGKADAGETIKSTIDSASGIPIVSLYGSQKKPGSEVLKDVDIVIFDIQDVGARFFTYIGTMHYVMEGCAENGKTLLILDRPNPNGYYVEGPVLDMKNKSFVGMHPVPVVHGLTVGEYAQMINGENWLSGSAKCNIKIIKVKNYTHKDRYSLPIKPSPNLPNDLSVKLYPSLCYFEGTSISVGRGTEFPFQVAGGPDSALGTFTFTPRNIPGMSKNPMHEGIKCFGQDYRNSVIQEGLSLKYLLDFYKNSTHKDKFFNNFFIKLSGTDSLKNQIIAGVPEEKIRESWLKELSAYKQTRKKYLLYDDF